MGRKPIAGERKFSRMVIRLTEAEKALIDSAAESLGVNASSWARELLLATASSLTPKLTLPATSPKKTAKTTRKVT